MRRNTFGNPVWTLLLAICLALVEARPDRSFALPAQQINNGTTQNVENGLARRHSPNARQVYLIIDRFRRDDPQFSSMTVNGLTVYPIRPSIFIQGLKDMESPLRCAISTTNQRNGGPKHSKLVVSALPSVNGRVRPNLLNKPDNIDRDIIPIGEILDTTTNDKMSNKQLIDGTTGQGVILGSWARTRRYFDHGSDPINFVEGLMNALHLSVPSEGQHLLQKGSTYDRQRELRGEAGQRPQVDFLEYKDFPARIMQVWQITQPNNPVHFRMDPLEVAPPPPSRPRPAAPDDSPRPPSPNDGFSTPPHQGTRPADPNVRPQRPNRNLPIAPSVFGPQTGANTGEASGSNDNGGQQQRGNRLGAPRGAGRNLYMPPS